MSSRAARRLPRRSVITSRRRRASSSTGSPPNVRRVACARLWSTCAAGQNHVSMPASAARSPRSRSSPYRKISGSKGPSRRNVSVPAAMHAPTGHPARRGCSARHGSSAVRSRGGSAPGGTSAAAIIAKRGGLVLGHVLAAAIRQYDGGDEEPLLRAVPAELICERRKRRVQQLDVRVEDDRDRTGDRGDAGIGGSAVADVVQFDRLRAVAARHLGAAIGRAAVHHDQLRSGQVPLCGRQQGVELARGVVRDRDECQAHARFGVGRRAVACDELCEASASPLEPEPLLGAGARSRWRARASARAPRAGRVRPGRRRQAGRGGRSCRPRSPPVRRRRGRPRARRWPTPRRSRSRTARDRPCAAGRARFRAPFPVPRSRRARRGRQGLRGRRGHSALRPTARRRRRARCRRCAGSYPAYARRSRAPGPVVSSRRSRRATGRRRARSPGLGGSDPGRPRAGSPRRDARGAGRRRPRAS